MIEFMEDMLEDDEDEARKARLKHLGRESAVTGDWLTDYWERQVARGETPDLDAFEPENARKRWEAMREASRRYTELTGDPFYMDPIQDHFLEIDQIENSRQFGDHEQLQTLTALAATGDRDAMEMLAEIQGEHSAGRPVDDAIDSRMPRTLNWVDPSSLDANGFPDELSFGESGVSERRASRPAPVIPSETGVADVFRQAGGSDADAAFAKAAEMGWFEGEWDD